MDEESKVKSQKSDAAGREYQYQDARRMVRYLRDQAAGKLGRELAALDEDDAVEALRHAEDLLGPVLSEVRFYLNEIVVDDDPR